ncbi:MULTISPECIES: M48 family metalloprotease [Sphingobium]|uniref:M48 family metalloprotease n=1 Tax=Sphingobium TaxID=165695 RepID=UPI0015EBF264|nr:MULTISPECIES: M48 family metalloprotease [Sphingobium]MCW2363742.1 putative Zn-dependent protease [Sphingobium sp. B10D3B]MCW2402860.1 putative Zn-dependent protease [Sphingobium sp. B10D7B]MCW2409838.1 putative Zn-dependent protease [Sphingobium xanthum]
MDRPLSPPRQLAGQLKPHHAREAAVAPWLIGRLLAVLALLSLLAAQPALAQSVLRDAETEALMRDASIPIIRAAGLDERNVQMLVINDPSLNAFVAGGQIVWFHSGLIAEADDLNQVQGVMAHELGHIEGGHIVRFADGAREATGIQLVSLLLGAAAMAAGGGEAGMGIMAAGQQAAMGRFLTFTRTQESSADAAGARYLKAAGISGKGSIAFFKKLQNLEYRLYVPQDTYVRTHPLSRDRISALTALYENDPAWNKPTDPALEARFQRVRAKLIGFVSEPEKTLKLYPPSDQSLPAHYARAYAYHKSAFTEKALAEVDTLLKAAPHDPYFLELQGQVMLESGKPADAIPPLREAVQRTNGEPLIAAMLGHALVATEDDSHLDEAERVLRNTVARDRQNPFAWYSLGVVYQRKGDTARAALATAERYSMEGQDALALRHADVALAGIQPNSPDYLRAQDIAMASRAAMERTRKK